MKRAVAPGLGPARVGPYATEQHLLGDVGAVRSRPVVGDGAPAG